MDAERPGVTNPLSEHFHRPRRRRPRYRSLVA
jgi:hypothetical protein